MPLLSDNDAAVLRQHLQPVTASVDLLLFTQAFGGAESGPIAKQVLDEIAALNDKVHVVEKNFVLDTDDRTRYGVEHAPCIVILRNGEDTRMRFLGAPMGYEFVPLVESVLMAGTGDADLTQASVDTLARVTTPTAIKVFSTPT